MRDPELRLLLCITLSCFFSISSTRNTSVPSSHYLCLPNQKSALLQFKNEFQPLDCRVSMYHPYPKMKYWSTDIDCCSWDGVTCDAQSGFVIGLNMRSSCLHGPLESHSSLFKLNHLQKLDLSDNHFNFSAIPAGIAQFKMLTHLNLSYSVFSERVPPQITQLNKLRSLNLSKNEDLYFREGDFKALIQNATGLTEVHLRDVNISSRALNFLVNLSSLSSLDLSRCNLMAKFPETILSLSSIRSINLADNPDLSVSLPEFYSNGSLELLDLSRTRFSGILPDSMTNLKSLSYLGLSDCNFRGEFPVVLRNLSQLPQLHLASNGFGSSAVLPLGNLRKLRVLDLRNNSLVGGMPSWLKNLTDLESLDLSWNKLNGPFPDALRNLTKLTFLNLLRNNFSGQLPPYINDLSRLSVLDLSYNSFSGSIPSSIFMIPSLTTLELSHNQLSGPLVFENVSSPISYLDSSGNNFKGHFPTPLSKFSNLRGLYLSHNSFEGQIPKSLWVMPHLERLDISYNKLSGLEESLTDLPALKLSNLTYLSLSGNKFKGPIPRSISNFTNLEVLYLSESNFEGEVPNSLWHMPLLSYINISYNSLSGFEGSLVSNPSRNITLLDLSHNKFQGILQPLPILVSYLFASRNNFTGEIPRSICKLKSLEILDLSSNHLSGTIPRCLGTSSNSLSVLNLHGNNLSGVLPQACNNGASMRTMDLGDNQLVGELPRSLIHCAQLEVLNLEKNRINDTFPSWLVDLPELQVLVLRSNRFHGQISSGSGFPKLHIIDISHNNFIGSVPLKFFSNWTEMVISDKTSIGLKYMGDRNNYYKDSIILVNKGIAMKFQRILTIFAAVDFSYNRFEGEIPYSIGDLRGLIMLNLSGNSFIGHIPSSLANLRNLESIDLSRNKLSGKIPAELESLSSLEVVNFAYNRLTGLIPQGIQFTTQSSSSFKGNPRLCGRPLKECDDIDAKNHAISQQESESEKLINWVAIAVGYMPGLILGLSVGHIITSSRQDWVMKIFSQARQRRTRAR